MNRRLAWLALICIPFACKKQPSEQADPAPTTSDAAAAVIPDAHPPADAAREGAWTARADGVGPIDAKTKPDVKALKKLLTGYEVKKESIPMGEGELREDYIGVSKGKTLVLKLVGDDDLVNVDIMTNDVVNPWGLQIGMAHADAVKLVGNLECVDGGEAVDWRVEILECSNEKLVNYTLDFTNEGNKAKHMLKDPAELAQTKLVAIRWDVPGAKTGPPGAQ
jgi:hypothetical protein